MIRRRQNMETFCRCCRTSFGLAWEPPRWVNVEALVIEQLLGTTTDQPIKRHLFKVRKSTNQKIICIRAENQHIRRYLFKGRNSIRRYLFKGRELTNQKIFCLRMETQRYRNYFLKGPTPTDQKNSYIVYCMSLHSGPTSVTFFNHNGCHRKLTNYHQYVIIDYQPLCTSTCIHILKI